MKNIFKILSSQQCQYSGTCVHIPIVKIQNTYTETVNIFDIVKLQAKSLDLELTLFYPCLKKKNNKKNTKNPHQNLSEGGVLEG